MPISPSPLTPVVCQRPSKVGSATPRPTIPLHTEYRSTSNRGGIMDMNRILVKGAAIVTMDRNLGDLPRGDILIEGDRIAAVAPEIDAPTASAINAADMIVLPGLINGHLHTWQTGLRGLASDWSVGEYMKAMHRGLATLFKTDDIYIA